MDRVDAVGLLDEMLSALKSLYNTSGHGQTKQFLVDCTVRMVSKKSTAPSSQSTQSSVRTKYEETLYKISSTLCALKPILSKAMTSNDIETIRSLGNLICGFAESECEFVAKGQSANLEVVGMILQLTAHSNAMVTEETFSFWSRLQDIEMKDRHPSLRQDLYIELLRALLLHAADPEEFDAHSRFQQNASEILISAYFILQSRFLEEIESKLKELFGTLSSTTTTASNPSAVKEVFLRIESCIFALAMIAQEVYDDRDNKQIQQSLNQHICPILDAVLKSKQLYVAPLTATSLHLWNQICHFVRGFSFYLCSRPLLLQQCLRFMVEVPVQSQPVMAYECAKCFQSILYHSASRWTQNLNDFENIVQFVIESVGTGAVFWSNLKENEVSLLKELTITDIDDADPAVMDVVSRQQRACAVYYEALCMVIDIYGDRKRQSAVMNRLTLKPTEQCDVILKENMKSIGRGDLQQLVADLRIFSGFVRGLKMTETAQHPLVVHIPKMLRISMTITRRIPQWKGNGNGNGNGNEQKQNHNDDGNGCDLLFDAMCDLMEAILDIFGSKTGQLLDAMVQIALEILKTTTSEASARIFKKMVSTFKGDKSVANKFVVLIKESMVYLGGDSVGDIRECQQTVCELFGCVGVMVTEYDDECKTEVWKQVVPQCIALQLKVLTRVQDRDALRATLKVMAMFFERKHRKWSMLIGDALKQSLLPNVMGVLFDGMTSRFERFVAKTSILVFWNLINFDAEFVRDQMAMRLKNANIAGFEGDEQKAMFLKAFWNQQKNRRKFDLVMTTFFGVCNNFDTADSFAALSELPPPDDSDAIEIL